MGHSNFEHPYTSELLVRFVLFDSIRLFLGNPLEFYQSALHLKHSTLKRNWLNYTSESILTTINTKSDMFAKFKSIQWFDRDKRQKRQLLKLLKKQRKFQVHFYENGITFLADDRYGEDIIRTSPFPILNLY